MRNKLFSVYDCKAESWMRPFVERSSGAAIRSFSDEVNSGSKDSVLSSHPEDYTLFELGIWDEHSGVIELHSTRKSLGVGIDFKRVADVRSVG